jgi:hypothetical protein
MLLVGALALCGLAGADDPPAEKAKDKSDGPLRLKRKKRDGAPPPVVKDKDGEPEGKPDPKKPGPKDKKAEPRLQPEDGPAAKEEDDKELLERIGKNMRAVEEKLGNRELGEPTRQQQRDILDDIDKLLKKSEQQQQQNQDQDQDRQPPQAGGDRQKQNQKQKMNRQQKGGKQGKQRPRRQLRSERDRDRDGKQQPGQEKQGQQKEGDKPEPKSGDKPGAGGGNDRPQERDLTADLYRNIWGHLPETLRAEMNAYSNPSPFLPRYDRVISEYYKTIARKGRQKGD